jgi:uncharacterized cupin superfamily protein
MTRPIVNLDELQYRDWGHGSPPMPGAGDPPANFQARIGDVGSRIGARRIGANVTVLQPGKRAFPFHNHHVNEEWFVVLDGSGEIRIGDATHAIRQGDVVCCVAGGPETAHQIINSGTGELRYLALSTQQLPELCDYPDSGKFAVMNRTGTDAKGQSSLFRFMSREKETLTYWEGE